MSRVAVITGASRGLGLSLAKRFLEKGDRVFAVSKTSRHWKSALSQLPKSNELSFHKVDLSSESQVKRFAKEVQKKAGRVDILINNAGYGGKLLRTEEIPKKEYDEVMQGNLLSAFLMSKHFIPLFRKQNGGVLINIASMAGVRAVPRLFSYSASKFGMLALSQCVAKENSDAGLKCYTVSPGGMNTTMRSDLFGLEDAGKQQSTDFVADVIFQTIEGKVEVESGGNIVIRHGKITDIQPCPGV